MSILVEFFNLSIPCGSGSSSRSYRSVALVTLVPPQWQPKTFYRKTVHTDESRGFGDLFIWFGDLLYKSVQGPIICHPLFPTTTRLLLAPVAIEIVSNFFSLFMWALGIYCFVQMSSSIFSCTVFLYKVFEWQQEKSPKCLQNIMAAIPAIFCCLEQLRYTRRGAQRQLRGGCCQMGCG